MLALADSNLCATKPSLEFVANPAFCTSFPQRRNYLPDSPEFRLTFEPLSGEKWGVVAENVTQDLNVNESGCENALFRDFRAFDGREEARGSTRAVAH